MASIYTNIETIDINRSTRFTMSLVIDEERTRKGDRLESACSEFPSMLQHHLSREDIHLSRTSSI